MARAFVFPGQGSQVVGMGRELCDAFQAARLVYEEVDEALGQRLSRVILDGPESELSLTENAQPALMATSLAVVRVLEDEAGLRLAEAGCFVAGHSLGEYSALAAAGALSLADTARLLRQRGRAMQQAVPVGEGAMAAVLGLELDKVRCLAGAAANGAVCALASDNAPGQVVVSGAASAIDRLIELAPARGARRAVRLQVSAPFHCALLAPAAAEMAAALDSIAIAAPAPALVANVTAEAVVEPARIRALLVEQMTAMVRWRESVLYMKDHDVDTLVELGAGKVLANLARRIDPELAGVAVLTPHDVEALARSL